MTRFPHCLPETHDRPPRHLLIGLGTGRCGTVSLSTLLSEQPSTCVIHEGAIDGERHLFRWSGNADRVLEWLRELDRRCASYERFGDVGFYFLPYVEAILDEWPAARFLVMQRDRDETVRSYERKTKGRNHWMEHDGTVWNHDARWDPTYPTYNAPSKRAALERYWDEYYRVAAELADCYPEAVRIFNVSALNSIDGRRSLLAFAGVASEAANLDGDFHENAVYEGPSPVFLGSLKRAFPGAVSWVGRAKGWWHRTLRSHIRSHEP